MAQQGPAPPAPGVIEVLDAPAAAGHAAGVLARLAERDRERAAEAARRLEELAVPAEPHENVERFLEGFAEQRRELDAALAGAAGSDSIGGDGGEGGGSGDAVTLAALAGRIAELEKSVADAAYFLPAYDLRQATLALAVLREQQEAAAAALQPRKRFAFNRRASKPATAPAASQGPAADGEQRAAAPAAAVANGTVGQQQAQQQPSVQQSGEQQQALQPPAADRPQQQGAPGPAGAAAATAASGSTLSGLRGQVVTFSREEAAGREFTLTDLEDCSVYLLAPLAALFLHRLRRCRVFTGPVAGACFIEGAEDCVLMIAARQVRIHAAARSDFYLRVRSHPIIEHSSNLRFAPYYPAYAGGGADLEGAGLAEDGGMWRRVNDFGWLRATPSPHWAELPDAAREAAPAGAAAQ
ncbi:hypothetical protein ABPG75_013936 [Micractinium tetrahymenae]